jgi:photosystem II stability/assembly factor-like uncharacterized protein
VLPSCTIKNEEKGEALGAMQFLGSMNAFPALRTPADAYGKAWETYKNDFSSRSVQSLSWRSLGPVNGGGRTKSIAIDPSDTSVIWLGSASGGLWKSESGGLGTNAWTSVSTGYPVHGVSSIAINPQNHLEMYIGTGETYDYGSSVNGLAIRTTRGSHGIGILKSTDGGITWIQSLNWLYNQERTVWDIIVNPLNPSTVFAATTEGIYRSTNSGNTWTLVLNATMSMDLDMHPSDTTVLFAGVGNLNSSVHGVFRSTDGGQNWSQLASGLPPGTNTGRIAVHITRANPSIVMAHITDAEVSVGLYRSFDGGNTWALLSNSDFASYQGWYSKCLNTRPDNASVIMVGGVYLHASQNSGQSFSQITTYNPSQEDAVPWPDLHDIIYNPLDYNKVYLLTDAGLYRSFNGTFSWQACNSGFNVYQFYQGSVFPTDSTLILGGLQDRNTRQWQNGNSWYPVGPGDGTFNAFDPLNASNQYTSSQYLYLQSSFYGNVFQGNQAAFVAPFMFSYSGVNTLYAGDRYINKSTDGGLTWFNGPEVDSGNPVICMDNSHTNEDLIYFGTAATVTGTCRVFKSDDSGFSLTDITNGLPNRYPRDIAVDPLNDQRVYVVFSGFGTGHIFSSANGGQSWTDISTALPDVPFHTILIDPANSNFLYAGSDLGVFFSSNAGQSWSAMNTGLPESGFIFDLKYSADNNNLVAFTHGRGAYTIPLDNLNVGIARQLSEKKIAIYPTVFDDFIIIENTDDGKAGDFLLFDMKGSLVFSARTTGDRMQKISLPAGLHSGVYIAKAGGQATRLCKK